MTPQELEINLSIIKEYLEKDIENGDMVAINEKLLKLSALTGLSADCMKWAKKYVLDAQGKALLKFKNTDTSPTVVKMFVESEISEQLMIFTYADRLNAAITHSMDSLRTLISLYKTELQNSQYQRA